MADESDDSATDLIPDALDEPTPSRRVPGQRYSRRLSDKILVSFHQACDQNDVEVARQLLVIYEVMLTRRLAPADGNRRRAMESLVAAHERLWHIRNPGERE